MPRNKIRARSNRPTSRIVVKGLQWLLSGCLLLFLLLNGAADPAIRPPLEISVAVICCLTVFVPFRDRACQTLTNRALLLGLFLCVWSIIQALPLPLWLPVHPIWQDLSATLGSRTGHLSVNPSATWQAIPELALPFAVFAASVMLSQSDALARGLWHQLMGAGVIVVGASFLREIFLPDEPFFLGQNLGTGQFSGVFVNRNVAASAFGITGFALLGSLAIKMAGDPSLQKKPNKSQQSQTFWIYALLISALFLTLLCLVLTWSRAGALITLVLILPCLILIARHGLRHRWTPWTSKRWFGSSVLVGFAAALIFLAAYGEPVLSRVETTDDGARWCTWISTFEAVKDNPLFGTGLGTFKDVFPMYRNSSCDVSSGVWHRAHNSFLELYLVMGLPFLVFVTVVYAHFSYGVLTGLRTRRSLKGVPFAMLGMVLFVSFHSLVDFPLQIPGIALYLSALMGAGMSICFKRQTHQEGHRLS